MSVFAFLEVIQIVQRRQEHRFLVDNFFLNLLLDLDSFQFANLLQTLSVQRVEVQALLCCLCTNQNNLYQ